MAVERIEVSGPGLHTIIEAGKGERITVMRMFLTFSHDKPSAQRVEFKSNDGTIAGPLYVLNGGVINYHRGQNIDYDMQRGQSLILSLSSGLSAAGVVEYEISGQW